ncbi:MAG: hypothetical protein R2843_06875 [Thermomicrobiales bacterium]
MPDYESLAGDLKEAAEFPGYGIGEEVDVTMQRERFLNAMEDDLDLRARSRHCARSPSSSSKRRKKMAFATRKRRCASFPTYSDSPWGRNQLSRPESLLRATRPQLTTCYTRRWSAEDRRRFFVCLSAWDR